MKPLLLLCQAAFLVLAMLLFDNLIEARPWIPNILWAPLDTLFHGIIAIGVVWPARARSDGRRIVLAAFLAATLIDLDHFIAAGSLSLADAASLPCRPPSHSLTLALLAGLVTRVLTSPAMAAAITAGLASHVLRDGGGGACTPILWPLDISGIPYGLYLGLTVVLGWAMFFLDVKHER